MVTDDDVKRARLVIAARGESGRIAAEIDAVLRGVSLSASRLSGIVNSLAWHQTRPSTAQRIEALAAELKRLHTRAAAESAERQIYSFLLAWLGLDQSPGEREAQLLRDLDLTSDERAYWMLEARLLLASVVVQTVEALARGEALRQMVERSGGALRWQ